MSTRTHRRLRTPPQTSDLLTPQSIESEKSYRRSPCSSRSPCSVETQESPPPRSPASRLDREIRPRIRKQDQMLDPIDVPYSQFLSYDIDSSNAYPEAYYTYVPTRPSDRRSRSPAEMAMVTPVSAMSFADSYPEWSRRSPPPNSLELQPTHGSHSRTISNMSMPRHTQTNVTSAPDESCLPRCAYPTYRQAPFHHGSHHGSVSYGNGSTGPGLARAHARSASAHPAPLPLQVVETKQYLEHPLSPELIFDSYVEAPPSTNLLDYLTEPNPSPAIVRKLPNPGRAPSDTHFWFDIRNIRSWKDFTLETIKKNPDLTKLLEFDIPEPALPTPSSRSLRSETLAALKDCHTAHYLVKVNAALKVSLGARSYMLMREAHSSNQAGAPQVPEYVSIHSEDIDKPVSAGQSRGRVVGLVRSYEQWNSGMRAGSPASKMSYLKELAHLQRFMREYTCRYGFIITEIELICVRMGTRVNEYPVFGLLELATPIQLHADGKDTLTAPLALWYLNMLSTNSPLPGQCPWKVEIGTITDLSRRNILPTDAWIQLVPEGKEKRDARRIRGWACPDEKLGKRERPRPQRASKKHDQQNGKSASSIAY